MATASAALLDVFAAALAAVHGRACVQNYLAANLVCGGSSRLVEVLPEGVSLTELRRANGWLLGSGLDIHAVNAVRKDLSCIKGGRLASRLGGRRAVQLLIS